MKSIERIQRSKVIEERNEVSKVGRVGVDIYSEW